MSHEFDPDEPYAVDSRGCLLCDYTPKVKGRFGLAWVSESPECPHPEPVGWQVEFHDTPSKVEQKCQEMVRWINCPPLPRCDPCPPVELCCPTAKKKYSYKKQQHQGECSCCKKQKHRKCCYCGAKTRPSARGNCYSNVGGGTCSSCRHRSPSRY